MVRQIQRKQLRSEVIYRKNTRKMLTHNVQSSGFVFSDMVIGYAVRQRKKSLFRANLSTLFPFSITSPNSFHRSLFPAIAAIEQRP